MLMTYLLYFGYMFLICFSMLLIFGTVGALTSLWFVRKIFSTIKVRSFEVWLEAPCLPTYNGLTLLIFSTFMLQVD